MLVKSIAACTHLFNRFPVQFNPYQFKSSPILAHFCTFWPAQAQGTPLGQSRQFFLLGWKEDSMLVKTQTHSSIYLSIFILQPFTSYSEILVGIRKLQLFPTPLHLTPPLGLIHLDYLCDFWWVSCRMAMATIWCKNIHEKLNHLSMVLARHRRQTDNRQTDCHAINETYHVLTFG